MLVGSKLIYSLFSGLIWFLSCFWQPDSWIASTVKGAYSLLSVKKPVALSFHPVLYILWRFFIKRPNLKTDVFYMLKLYAFFAFEFLTYILPADCWFFFLLFTDFPPMILTENDEDYTAVEGKRVMMHCKVFSSPPSAITWYVSSYSCPQQTSREQQKSNRDCTLC